MTYNAAMPKELGNPPSFGRRKREVPPSGGMSSNVINLEHVRRERESQKALLANVATMRTIIANLMQEPPWVDMKNLDIVTQIAVHKDKFHPGVPAERLRSKITTNESLIRASGPLVYMALLEALEERDLIPRPEA